MDTHKQINCKKIFCLYKMLDCPAPYTRTKLETVLLTNWIFDWSQRWQLTEQKCSFQGSASTPHRSHHDAPKLWRRNIHTSGVISGYKYPQIILNFPQKDWLRMILNREGWVVHCTPWFQLSTDNTDPPEDHVDELLVVHAAITVHVCLSNELLFQDRFVIRDFSSLQHQSIMLDTNGSYAPLLRLMTAHHR